MPLQANDCIVIGAGLAGSSVAFSLAQRGWRVVVLDRGEAPATGASGLPVGLLAPHVSPDDRALSRLSRIGVAHTLARAQALLQEGVDWAHSGVLEHRVDGKRALPPGAPSGLAGLAYPLTSIPATPQQLRQAGLAPMSPAHWHPQGGWIRPGQLVRAMLAQPGITWRGGQLVHRLERAGSQWQVIGAQGTLVAQAPLVVVAAGFDSLALCTPATPNGPPLPLSALRGQVAWGAMPAEPNAALPPFPVNGLGSLACAIPTEQGPIWCTGSTFDRHRATPELDAQDHQANLARLHQLLPQAGQVLAPLFAPGQAHAWAGVRCTAPDRLPVLGPLNQAHEGALPALWISTAMGARGLTFAVLCGELLAAQLHGEPAPLEPALARLLMARRWADHKT